MVRAQADRAVRELARGQWQVHSVFFSHAINLVNDRERRLLLLAPHQGRQVPGGLSYLPRQTSLGYGPVGRWGKQRN
ncbi:hypothetical protein HCZ04_09280 [Limosilactobacillus fermentum]